MSMIASFPDGLRRLGLWRIGLTASAFCLAPAVVGGLILLATMVLGPGILGINHLRAEGLAVFALVSPLMSLPIWAAIALGSAGLLKVTSFGWLPAAVLGVVAFGMLSRTEIGPISLPFGAASAVLYRMALALQRPEAF
jgi:hypothetical protein